MDIIGYEGLYTIDIEGNVFGKKRKKILKPWINNGGYFCVGLCKNGITSGFQLHRLIAIHFKPNPNNLPQVDHKDGDRLNNNIINLRWVTLSEQGMNKGIYGNNKSGFRGVHFHKAIGKYVARIMLNGKEKHLGCFDIAKEASDIYEAEATKHFGEFKRN